MGGFCQLVKLHREGSAACAAGLFWSIFQNFWNRVIKIENKFFAFFNWFFWRLFMVLCKELWFFALRSVYQDALFEPSCVAGMHACRFRCQVSGVRCQVSGVTCFFLLFFLTKWWGWLVEGLLSVEPTLSSFKEETSCQRFSFLAQTV